jgi:hypothetical protein
MKPLAVLMTERPIERPRRLSCDRGCPDSDDLPLGGVECNPASQAFDEYHAKDVKGCPHLRRPENLKPNIYYKAQDFTRGADRVPGCRSVSRGDRHLSGTRGEESEPVGPAANAWTRATETSSASDRTAHAGFSFDEPAAWMVEDAACDC